MADFKHNLVLSQSEADITELALKTLKEDLATEDIKNMRKGMPARNRHSLSLIDEVLSQFDTNEER